MLIQKLIKIKVHLLLRVKSFDGGHKTARLELSYKKVLITPILREPAGGWGGVCEGGAGPPEHQR